jgi:hypothetical protein
LSEDPDWLRTARDAVDELQAGIDALYVLVRRSGQWWLTAGQNTPFRPKP